MHTNTPTKVIFVNFDSFEYNEVQLNYFICNFKGTQFALFKHGSKTQTKKLSLLYEGLSGKKMKIWLAWYFGCGSLINVCRVYKVHQLDGQLAYNTCSYQMGCSIKFHASPVEDLTHFPQGGGGWILSR